MGSRRGGNIGELSTYAAMLGLALCKLGRNDEAEPFAQQGRELGNPEDVLTHTLLASGAGSCGVGARTA